MCILAFDDIFISDSSGLDAGIKLRPREDELHELGPDFESRWKDYFANKPDKPIVFIMGLSRYVLNHRTMAIDHTYYELDFRLATSRHN